MGMVDPILKNIWWPCVVGGPQSPTHPWGRKPSFQLTGTCDTGALTVEHAPWKKAGTPHAAACTPHVPHHALRRRHGLKCSRKEGNEPLARLPSLSPHTWAPPLSLPLHAAPTTLTLTRAPTPFLLLAPPYPASSASMRPYSAVSARPSDQLVSFI